MNKFIKQFEQKFGFDVTALPTYVDEQSENFITDLIETSTFLSQLTPEEGVKGSRTIKLLSADATLQTMSGCAPNPDGTVTFTGRDLAVTRLYYGIEFCPEDLINKYTQMLLAIGAKRQDQELVLQDVLLAYLGRLLRRKAERVAILGDTASGDPELALFDGFVKLITNDASAIDVASTETSITSSNAYDVLKEVYDAIPSEVFDDGLALTIICGRETARACIDQVYNDNRLNGDIEFMEEGGSISFVLPTTSTRVQSYPMLNGTDEVFGFIWPYAFMGFDQESDIDDLDVKYHEYDNKLKVETFFRLGVQFVLPQYWTYLTLGN